MPTLNTASTSSPTSTPPGAGRSRTACHRDDDRAWTEHRHDLLQRPADQQRRPAERRDQHAARGSRSASPDQVGAGGRRAEQGRHTRMPGTNHCSDEPPSGHLAEQRGEQAEEDQRLDQPEDDRERVPDHGRSSRAKTIVVSVTKCGVRGSAAPSCLGAVLIGQRSLAGGVGAVVRPRLAQAAAGQGEEDVVQGRAARPRRRVTVAVRGQRASSPGSVAAPSATPQVDGAPSTSTRASGTRSSRRAAWAASPVEPKRRGRSPRPLLSRARCRRRSSGRGP